MNFRNIYEIYRYCTVWNALENVLSFSNAPSCTAYRTFKGTKKTFSTALNKHVILYSNDKKSLINTTHAWSYKQYSVSIIRICICNIILCEYITYAQWRICGGGPGVITPKSQKQNDSTNRLLNIHAALSSHVLRKYITSKYVSVLYRHYNIRLYNVQSSVRLFRIRGRVYIIWL